MIDFMWAEIGYALFALALIDSTAQGKHSLTNQRLFVLVLYLQDTTSIVCVMKDLILDYFHVMSCQVKVGIWYQWQEV